MGDYWLQLLGTRPWLIYRDRIACRSWLFAESGLQLPTRFNSSLYSLVDTSFESRVIPLSFLSSRMDRGKYNGVIRSVIGEDIVAQHIRVVIFLVPVELLS